MTRNPIMSDSCSSAIDLRSILLKIENGDFTRAFTRAVMPSMARRSLSSVEIVEMVSRYSACISSRRAVIAA
ncbi:hypothetical protein D3C78_1874420 [compost metagenome]